MAYLRTEAVILRQRDYSEADKIITVYSLERGKISCIGKGVKKIKSKLRGSILPFTYCDLNLYQGKSFYTITGADVKEGFVALRKDYVLLAYASYISELLESLVPEEEPNRSIFILLLGTFHLLLAINPEIAVKVFEIRLLRLLGYSPGIQACINCNNEKDLQWFSSEQGGALCSVCYRIDPYALPVKMGSLKILQTLDTISLSKVSRLKLKKRETDEIDSIIEKYLYHIIGKKLNSREFLKKFITS